MIIKALSPEHWTDYKLIDCGEGMKLERFGKWILSRPEPQAVWKRDLSFPWDKAHARFSQEGSSSGQWEKSPARMPDQWYIKYASPRFSLKFRLGLTSFKHVGIFPEQAVNWEYIYQKCQRLDRPKVLNLFAYTGGASLAAKAGGADIIHCDSIRQVVNWAHVNMEASGLSDIRWLVEDALKFVKREARRGRQYDGIMLDPPAWGHGPKGEKWKLEEQIDTLVEEVSKILAPKKRFLVFNAYSMAFSPLILENLLLRHFGEEAVKQSEIGELFLPAESGLKLPAGIVARFSDLT